MSRRKKGKAHIKPLTGSERVLAYRERQRKAGKKMITVFIDEKDIKKVDEMVSSGKFKSRDAAIEHILHDFFASPTKGDDPSDFGEQ